MIRLVAATACLILGVTASGAPPRPASLIGTSAPPQISAGAPGFASLFPNATAYTPGMSRSATRGGRGGAIGGGFSGGRIGPATGFGRHGVRPPIPTPPTRLGRPNFGGRR